jgi:chromosome segregation ATPase
LAAKAAAMKELERNLLAKIDTLNLQLREKQELWQSRSTELEAFRSEINVLTARLADMASAKERVETLLQQELKSRAEALQAKDVSWKEVQTKLTGKVRHLENQITERDAVLAQRHAELDTLGTQLTNMQSSSTHREERLRQELKETTEILQAKDLKTKELEDSLAKIADAGKKEINEREKLLKSRDEELERLRSEVNALNAQLNKINLAMARPAELPQEQTANEGLNTKLEESSKKILALESSLREKEDLLKTHDGKIERLETELKEKRTELAKHEIAVWQAYERRALWKQRLSKFGISIKD